MARVIDTSVLIELERRRHAVTDVALIGEGEPLAIAAVTAAELLVGGHRASSVRRRETRNHFAEVLFPRLPILPYDLRVARHHARIWAELAAAGRTIDSHDLMIGATALTFGYSVLTLNVKDFERVPGLVVHRPEWEGGGG